VITIYACSKEKDLHQQKEKRGKDVKVHFKIRRWDPRFPLPRTFSIKTLQNGETNFGGCGSLLKVLAQEQKERGTLRLDANIGI